MKVCDESNSRLQERWVAYHREVDAIRKKLKNNISDGKKGRILFPLKDLNKRLIPELVQEMQKTQI